MLCQEKSLWRKGRKKTVVGHILGTDKLSNLQNGATLDLQGKTESRKTKISAETELDRLGLSWSVCKEAQVRYVRNLLSRSYLADDDGAAV